MESKVSVIGGGTAGLVTARKLASFGLETTVYDQKKILGEPVRASGILSIRGLEKIGIGYAKAVTNTLYGATIHAGGESLKVESDDAVAHVLDRKQLNDICHDEAVAEGAEVILGRRITGKELDGMAANGIVVGADGAVSEVARHFGMGRIKRYVLTYKAEYNIRNDNRRIVDLFFDNKISKGLFGWMCPNSEDILEVGIGIDSSSGNAMSAFSKFISRKPISEVLGNSKRISEGASMIPLSRRKSIVNAKQRVLLVGDAAGQVKPSTGGGIIYGSSAGLMAANAIKDYYADGKKLGAYDKMYRKNFMLDTWMHSMVRGFYSGVGDKGMGLTLKVLENLRFGNFLGRYGDMDMPTQIIRNFLDAKGNGQEISPG